MIEEWRKQDEMVGRNQNRERVCAGVVGFAGDWDDFLSKHGSTARYRGVGIAYQSGSTRTDEIAVPPAGRGNWPARFCINRSGSLSGAVYDGSAAGQGKPSANSAAHCGQPRPAAANRQPGTARQPEVRAAGRNDRVAPDQGSRCGAEDSPNQPGGNLYGRDAQGGCRHGQGGNRPADRS